MRAVYERVQQQQHPPAFPLRFEDRLKEDLHIDVGDLDMDVAVEVEQRTGRSLKDADANPYFGKVEPVRDLVLFFSIGRCARPNPSVKRTRNGVAPGARGRVVYPRHTAQAPRRRAAYLER